MTDIRFYHLQKQSLDQALPLILEKAYGAGHRTVVRLRDKKEVERMSAHLWVYKDKSFLPHGCAKDGNAEQHPIWLTPEDDCPNNAKAVILTQGRTEEDIASFDLACEVLNGHLDEEVQAARARWKTYQEAGHDVTYWFQNENGGWEKKA